MDEVEDRRYSEQAVRTGLLLGSGRWELPSPRDFRGRACHGSTSPVPSSTIRCRRRARGHPKTTRCCRRWRWSIHSIRRRGSRGPSGRRPTLKAAQGDRSAGAMAAPHPAQHEPGRPMEARRCHQTAAVNATTVGVRAGGRWRRGWWWRRTSGLGASQRGAGPSGSRSGGRLRGDQEVSRGGRDSGQAASICTGKRTWRSV